MNTYNVRGGADFGTCANEHKDCFAYLNGRCRILTDGTFQGDCPFYKKNKEEIKNGREHTGSTKENHNFS